MNLLKECEGAKTIGISAHIRPDGDAIGSSMALYLYMRKAFPKAQVKVFLETPPGGFAHLKYLHDIDSDYVWKEDFDVFFALDVASDRLGRAENFFLNAKKRINIDHHISNQNGCGDVNLVKPEVGSTAEVLFGLMEEQYMDADIAVALYTGMIHDTGVFQYSNTTPETLRVAAKLLEYDFPFSKIIEESFYLKTYVQNQLLAEALLASRCLLKNSCIVSAVRKETLEQYHAEASDLEGIVNQMRNTKGISCAIFMYELAETGDGLATYKVSMRSDEKVDVAAIASLFGGGGHKRAAGLTMTGSVQEITDRLLPHVEAQLKDDLTCTMV